MQCLWLTLADPDPATNGQLLYSRGLIDSVRDAGARLRVVGLRRPEKAPHGPHRDDIDWLLGEEVRRSLPRRLASPLPAVALRAGSSGLRRAVVRSLCERRWDAVVFDSICGGWALDAVQRHAGRSRHRPRLVYLAHNCEGTVARHIADRASGVQRLWKAVDGLKAIRLERRLVRAADLVTSNTPDDVRSFRAMAGEMALRTPVELVMPGYDGPRVAVRAIDASLPRRAILVGSLDWPPKRAAIESFLFAGAAILARAGVELQVVGEAEESYLDGLRRRFPSVDFVGRVDDVRPAMARARLALVPDLLGGFKLKGLDYVFNRLPVLAMRGALPGMPLEDGRSIDLFDDHAGLARGIVARIDDVATLQARQAAAYDACADRFDWSRVGRRLLDAIEAARPGRGAA